MEEMVNPLQPRFTKNRLLAGVAILIVASAFLIPLGVDPMGFFLGVVFAILILGAVAGIMIWRRRKVLGQRTEERQL